MKKMLICLLPLLFVFVSACAFKETAVNNLETVISYRLGSQLHLYYSQKQELSKSVQQWLLDEKQKTTLAKAQTFLQDFNWQNSDLEASYYLLNDLYRQIALSFNDLLAKQISMLDEHQREKFFETLEEQNEKIQKGQSRKAGIERTLEFFFDDLSAEQVEILNQFFLDQPQKSSARLERRLESQKRIKEIFLDKDIVEKSDAIKQALNQAVRKPIAVTQLKRNLDFFNTFKKKLSPQQLEYFEKKKQDALEILSLYLLRQQ